jgi:hypothetical protein
MKNLQLFYSVVLAIQILHSIEELSTGFHKKWYLFKMPFWVFLAFEVVFSLFWVTVLVNKAFPSRELFQTSFLILMFANGIQHLVWWGIKKRYVPGLVTAFLHILVFLILFTQVLLK